MDHHGPSRLRLEQVPAADVQPLRTRILRSWPGPLCEYAEDDLDDTYHFALLDEEGAWAVVTYVRRPCAQRPGEQAYQLRGMAVALDAQRQGCGTRLVEASLIRLAAAEPGARWVWCNARLSAVEFYERMGFEGFGDVFEIEGIGPHLRMMREMPRVLA